MTNDEDHGATLTVTDLTKQYRSRTALDCVNLRARAGEVVAVVGPNGAGKTTLFRIVAGLARATSGTLTVSRSGTKGPQLAALIDGPGLYGQLSGLDNLRALSWTAGLPVSRAEAREALARVGLEVMSRRVATYSTGMRQRLAVACALLSPGRLVILDEPTSGMDPVGIRDMRAVISSLAAEGRTILWSSHDLREVEDLAATVVLLSQGKVQYCGPPGELPSKGEVIEIVVDPVGTAITLLRTAGIDAMSDGGEDAVMCTGAPLQMVLKVLAGGGIVPSDVRVRQSSLEDLFFRLAAREDIGRQGRS